MRFDYRFGTEATFLDWKEDGCKRAEAMLDALERGYSEPSEETEPPSDETK